MAILAALWALLSGCAGLEYHDEVRPSGLTNFHVLVPPSPGVAGIYRTGIPATPAAVADLRGLVGRDVSRKIVRLSLHDPQEGSEDWVSALGWDLVSIPLYPEDDAPWTVFLRPKREDVARAVSTVLDAHGRGDIVVLGCVHDRERGGLVSAMVGGVLFGWSKTQQYDYMVATGSRIAVTPGLLEFYLTEM